MATIPDYLYILMKDVQGEKAPGKIMAVLSGGPKPVQVLRGELLTQIPRREWSVRKDGRPPHNYRTMKDSSVTLYGGEDDEYVSPLNGGDLQLLGAIEKPWDRFDVFSEDSKLEWGGKLKRGDQVYVKLPTLAPTWSAGVVRHVGGVGSLPGRKFGVEIKDSRYLGKGSSDGFFGGYSYFECEYNCGIFVSLDKLVAKPPHQVPHSAIPPQQPKSSTLPGANPHIQGSCADKPPVFKINDRVIVYNRKKEPMHGTVRWIGRDIHTRTLDTNHIGIETDWAAITNLFPKALTGITHLFKAISGQRVVVPEHLVFREELANTRTPPAQDVDHSDPAAAACKEGMTEQQWIPEQEKALKAAEEVKRKEDRKKAAGNTSNPDLREVKGALPLDESLNLPAQKEALKAFKKAKENAQKGQNLTSTNAKQHEQGRENLIQKQHSWHPGDDPTYETIPGDGNIHPLPRQNRQNEGSVANIQIDHERVHQQHGGYPPPNYSQPPQDQEHHRGTSQTHDPGYPPHHGNTRPEGVQQPQRDVRRVNSHNQMTPQNTASPDYANWEVMDQYLRSQRNDQSNQPPQGNQQQGNPVYPQQPGAQQYHNMGETYQYQEQLSGQEFGRDSNKTHPPPNNPGYGHQPHHDTPGGHHQSAFVNVSEEYNPYNLAVGSSIQVATINPNDPPHYGVIRWTGRVAGVDCQVAGIELEDYMEGCTDGTLKATGENHFTCTFGRGLYFPLASLRPDGRFGDIQTASAQDNPVQGPMEEQADQTMYDSSQQLRKYIGNSRGIQGHQNSCYLDSTLFGLFALNDIFDSMFLAPDQSITTDQNRKRVANLLWKGIVNPLRKNGVVRFESVMKMRNALDELGKMEGITEKEKDPEEFLNMLFKYVLHTRPFISIRRPFGVEQEFFVQLFVEHDPNLRLPYVGDLLRKMFLEQHISFTKVPSKLLLQVSQFGREFQTCKRIIPELKLDIGELTDTYKKTPAPACHSCGEESTIRCESCGPLSQQQFTHYCQRCSDLFHRNPSYKDRVKHRLTAVAATPADDPGLAQLDLVSVICIETSHYVCFTRDPTDEIQKKWIFFDSMADRQYDTYCIPRVTDCTRELNEWVYSDVRGRDKLFSTPSRELPELVRRFTHDIYMCVYVQPDVAMYGHPYMYGDDSQIYSSSVAPTTVPKLTESKDDIVEELKQENTSLQAENQNLHQRIETYQTEQSQHIQLLEAELQDRKLAHSQEMAEKEEQLQHQKQQSENEKRQLERQSQRYQQQALDMQRRLEVAESKTSQSKFSKLQIPRLDQDSWNVRRQEVVLQDNLGHGAWGSVCRGFFRGQRVAVKCAHKEILHKNTIDQLKREIRIMAHVQHPNLVRLIAAVVDAGVERGTDSPLLVLELLDTDVRSAYIRKIVTFKKDALLSIFREVAYALHYLHEHQEPIIHRDVSAPNVLLQQIHPGVWKAKLSDFGSANLAKSCKTAAPGAIVYAAPETFPPSNLDDPLPKQTTKIDVYSYGYLLAEAIAKEMPSRENRRAMLLRIKSEWEQVYDIITACVESQPDNRLTMTQVLEKLNMLPSQ